VSDAEEEGNVDTGIKDVAPAAFRLGEVVRHRKFGYRGVILGWDIRPLGDANAIASRWEGVVGLPSGADQPFYRVLPDEGDVEDFLGAGAFRSSFYVAEENLQLVRILFHVIPSFLSCLLVMSLITACLPACLSVCLPVFSDTTWHESNHHPPPPLNQSINHQSTLTSLYYLTGAARLGKRD
jgi:hemimethylated DNA binding protein